MLVEALKSLMTEPSVVDLRTGNEWDLNLTRRGGKWNRRGEYK
jgi:hypothetical protein